jgi:hypothetical protein
MRPVPRALGDQVVVVLDDEGGVGALSVDDVVLEDDVDRLGRIASVVANQDRAVAVVPEGVVEDLRVRSARAR